MTLVRRCFSVGAGSLAMLLAGCGYHLGSEATPGFSSISISPIKNDSFAPQIQAEMHRQLSDSLAQEQSLHVVSSGGQANLAVRFSDYRRDIGAVNSNDTVTAASYRLTLSARATLTDSTGKVLFKERLFTASLPAYSPNGFSRTETQTVTLLTRELARKIKDSVVDVW